MPTPKSRARVARNFVNRYGPDGLAKLLTALSNADSGQVIADEFDVSRERVRQWKNTFGRVVTMYQVHPEVQRILDESGEPEEADLTGALDIDISF